MTYGFKEAKKAEGLNKLLCKEIESKKAAY